MRPALWDLSMCGGQEAVYNGTDGQSKINFRQDVNRLKKPVKI